MNAFWVYSERSCFSVKIQFNLQLLELLYVYGRWGLRHQVLCFLGLGKGDDIPDRRDPREQRYDPIKAKRDSPMGRRTVLERLQQKPELGLGLVRTDPQGREHLTLDVPTMDPDAAAAKFLPVHDQVVGLGPNLPGVGLEEWKVLVQ